MNYEAKIKELDILIQEIGRWVFSRNQKGLDTRTLTKAGLALEEYRNIVNENWKLNGNR